MKNTFNYWADWLKGRIDYDFTPTLDDPDPNAVYPRHQYPSGYSMKLRIGRSAFALIMAVSAIGATVAFSGVLRDSVPHAHFTPQ